MIEKWINVPIKFYEYRGLAAEDLFERQISFTKAHATPKIHYHLSEDYAFSFHYFMFDDGKAFGAVILGDHIRVFVAPILSDVLIEVLTTCRALFLAHGRV